MGCGCGNKNRQSSTNSTPAQQSVPAVSPTVSAQVKSTTIPMVSSTENTKKKDCFDMYPLLTGLDKKAVAIINKTNISDRQINLKAREINKQLRQWIGELRIKCPNEELVKEISGWVNDNYFKYHRQ